jgi:hypothetical protein
MRLIFQGPSCTNNEVFSYLVLSNKRVFAHRGSFLFLEVYKAYLISYFFESKTEGTICVDPD